MEPNRGPQKEFELIKLDVLNVALELLTKRYLKGAIGGCQIIDRPTNETSLNNGFVIETSRIS